MEELILGGVCCAGLIVAVAGVGSLGWYLFVRDRARRDREADQKRDDLRREFRAK